MATVSEAKRIALPSLVGVRDRHVYGDGFSPGDGSFDGRGYGNGGGYE